MHVRLVHKVWYSRGDHNFIPAPHSCVTLEFSWSEMGTRTDDLSLQATISYAYCMIDTRLTGSQRIQQRTSHR